MDVPGWAVEVKRTEVLTLPLFWAQAKRQAEQLGAGRFCSGASLARSGLHSLTRTTSPPEIFQPGRSAVTCRCRDGARAGAVWRRTIRYGIGGMKYELHPSAPYFRACRDKNSTRW